MGHCVELFCNCAFHTVPLEDWRGKIEDRWIGRRNLIWYDDVAKADVQLNQNFRIGKKLCLYDNPNATVLRILDNIGCFYASWIEVKAVRLYGLPTDVLHDGNDIFNIIVKPSEQIDIFRRAR